MILIRWNPFTNELYPDTKYKFSSILPLEKDFSEILTKIQRFSFENLHFMKCQPLCWGINILTRWGRVTQTCVSRLTIIGSDNGFSPCRRQVNIWTNAGILLIGPLWTILSEILIEIDSFLLKKMHLKMSSGKWRLFCLGLTGVVGWWNILSQPVGRLNKKNGLTRYGDSHAKDKRS